MISIRHATITDLDNILLIIKQAQQYMQDNQIDQWQNGYPNKNDILSDIEQGFSLVLEQDYKIIATCCLMNTIEKTYQIIDNGHWIHNDNYLTIHRIAIDNQYKGQKLASKLIEYAINYGKNNHYNSLKVDTHCHNNSMNRFLLNNNFVYCGIIHLTDGSERLAYELDFKKL